MARKSGPLLILCNNGYPDVYRDVSSGFFFTLIFLVVSVFKHLEPNTMDKHNTSTPNTPTNQPVNAIQIIDEPDFGKPAGYHVSIPDASPSVSPRGSRPNSPSASSKMYRSKSVGSIASVQSQSVLSNEIELIEYDPITVADTQMKDNEKHLKIQDKPREQQNLSNGDISGSNKNSKNKNNSSNTSTVNHNRNKSGQINTIWSSLGTIDKNGKPNTNNAWFVNISFIFMIITLFIIIYPSVYGYSIHWYMAIISIFMIEIVSLSIYLAKIEKIRNFFKCIAYSVYLIIAITLWLCLYYVLIFFLNGFTVGKNGWESMIKRQKIHQKIHRLKNQKNHTTEDNFSISGLKRQLEKDKIEYNNIEIENGNLHPIEAAMGNGDWQFIFSWLIMLVWTYGVMGYGIMRINQYKHYCDNSGVDIETKIKNSCLDYSDVSDNKVCGIDINGNNVYCNSDIRYIYYEIGIILVFLLNLVLIIIVLVWKCQMKFGQALFWSWPLVGHMCFASVPGFLFGGINYMIRFFVS